ncbi:proline-rich 16-like, putative [Babesia ovis]|uniref:Proline-rich 16-like, putative n=1 Tax=Babesia ovis TaxID=5869 RepID=A0A9W5TC77_BABOV|nr:proline-rich 16-like, putative [Babesia ovis]
MHTSYSGVNKGYINSDRTTLIQCALEKTHENVSKLWTDLEVLTSTLKKSSDCFSELLLLSSQGRKDLAGTPNTKPTNGPSLQSQTKAAQQYKTLVENLESTLHGDIKNLLEQLGTYATNGATTKHRIPVELGTHKMTPDELIFTLMWLPNSGSGDTSRESSLRKSIVETHFELINATKFYNELRDCDDLPHTRHNLSYMANHRVERTKHMLSRFIRELIALDSVYEDFFYEYLTAKENADLDTGSINPDTLKDIRNAISTFNSNVSGDMMRSHEERLSSCVSEMVSLLAKLTKAFNYNQ